jgi:hypothetical protein
MESKYAHLKFKLMAEDYQYVLFQDKKGLESAQALLLGQDVDYTSFAFQGEYSLICTDGHEFANAQKVQKGWSAFKIVGEMPFGTVQGLIATVSATLFEEKLGVCLVSTFLTDLFFIKKNNVPKSKELLERAGWKFVE